MTNRDKREIIECSIIFFLLGWLFFYTVGNQEKIVAGQEAELIKQIEISRMEQGG